MSILLFILIIVVSGVVIYFLGPRWLAENNLAGFQYLDHPDRVYLFGPKGAGIVERFMARFTNDALDVNEETGEILMTGMRRTTRERQLGVKHTGGFFDVPVLVKKRIVDWKTMPDGSIQASPIEIETDHMRYIHPYVVVGRNMETKDNLQISMVIFFSLRMTHAGKMVHQPFYELI